MALPASDDELQQKLKSSLRRSIRRAQNRLERDGVPWRIETVSEPGPELDRGIARLVELHKARAQLEGRLRHGDSFAAEGQAAFLNSAASAMAAAGRLQLLSVNVDDETAASVLLLRTLGATFMSVSGMDPRWWDYGLVTLLQRECLRSAIECGDRTFNFLRGPNYAKLRWSEELEVHQNFHLVAGRRRSHRLYALFAAYRALAEFRIRSAQRVLDTPPPGGRVRRALRREHDPGQNP
jgi:CelD/BcsL family acetyltransferase involved in cellulose biosynthesis